MKFQIDENEFKRMRYEFDEYKDLVPLEWQETISRAYKLMEPWFIYELPMSRDLLPVIEQLILKQYADLLAKPANWLSEWVHEISSQISDKLAEDIIELFMNFEAGTNLTVLYDDFDETVKFFARPHQPNPPAPLSDYDDIPIPQEDKERLIREHFEERKQECDLHNRLQKEFIDAVQPIIFRYFGNKMDDLDTESWNHYGVTVGAVFHDYNDSCIDLEYSLKYDYLDDNPCMGFYEYTKMVKDEMWENIRKIDSV